MNYLLELKNFYRNLTWQPLSTGQIALWHALMAINNQAGWAEWFRVHMSLLELYSGLSRSGITQARKELCERGLVQLRVDDKRTTWYSICTQSRPESVPYIIINQTKPNKTNTGPAGEEGKDGKRGGNVEQNQAALPGTVRL